MFVALKAPSSRHLLPVLFIFCWCYTFYGNAVVVPLAGNGPYKMALGDWEEWLRVQRDAMPSIVDKSPNQAPKFYAKIPYATKREDKRREFEHGWEQCEFSPISCMLRRKKR
uniref:Secreted protein n=1 Tax=Globodera pallida TaxID=36090 RepID=A0A183BJZ3_GLOPA